MLTKTTWNFLDVHNLEFHMASQYKLPRRGNSYIIEAAYQQVTSEEQLIWVNKCPLFLCVLTLSDIVDGSGTILLDQAWLGEPLVTQHNMKSWPFQAKLPPQAWEI
jgi:hypothetical protein